MKIFRIVVVVIIITVVLLFVIPNSKIIIPEFAFLNQRYENARLVYLMLYAFLFGLASVFIFAIADEITLRHQLSRQRRTNQNMAEELDALRNLPLGPEEPEEKSQ
jgi:uncharacterized integral membrane protein